MKQSVIYKWIYFLAFFGLIAQYSQAQTGRIQGKIFGDDNNNCTFNAGEETFNQLVVSAKNSQNIEFFTLSDSFGNYIFDLQPDTYLIKPNLAYDGLYYSVCSPTNATVSVQAAQIDTSDWAYQPIANSNLLRTELSASRLEPCKTGLITVGAQNVGSDTAYLSEVRLILDPKLNFVTTVSNNFSITSLTNDTFLLTFLNRIDNSSQLPQLAVFAVNVDCDARPNQLFYNKLISESQNLAITPFWNDAILKVNNTCNVDTVLFEIENKGQINQNPIEYYVIEDNIMLRQSTVNLQPNQSVIIRQLAQPNRSYRLEVKNPTGLPAVLGDSFAYAINERCDSVNGINEVMAWFPTNDVSPFYDYETTIGSQGADNFYVATSPIGYDTAHYVNQGSWIEYNIQFRNTQGSTIRYINILDTLSAFVDVNTLQMGSSSHPYSFALNNNALNITFYNPNLRDSSASYSASLGFLSFRAKLKPNLANNTRITNRAHILFDNNFAYYHTDEVFHTVGQNYILILADNRIDLPSKTVQIFPNPFTHQVQFFIKDEAADLQLLVFNSLGQNIANIEQPQSNQIDFIRPNMPAGIYYYQLFSNQQLIATGKMIAE